MKVSKGQSQPEIVSAGFFIFDMVLGRPFLIPGFDYDPGDEAEDADDLEELLNDFLARPSPVHICSMVAQFGSIAFWSSRCSMLWWISEIFHLGWTKPSKIMVVVDKPPESQLARNGSCPSTDLRRFASRPRASRRRRAPRASRPVVCRQGGRPILVAGWWRGSSPAQAAWRNGAVP